MAAMDVFGYGKGRATRMEFWVATLVLPVLYPIGISVSFDYWTKQIPYLLVFALVAIWSDFAVQRCHDRNLSGWWCIIALVPLAGQLWTVIELGGRPGTEGENRFGPDPLAAQRLRESTRRGTDKLSPDQVKERREAAYELYKKISALDTGTPDMNRLIDALRLFERETGKALKMSIDTVGEPLLTILRRAEGSTSHNLVVEHGAYIDWIADGPDRYDTRYETLCEAVFEFAADPRTSMWAQEFRRQNSPAKQL